MFYAIYMRDREHLASEQASPEAARAILQYETREKTVDMSRLVVPIGVYDSDENVLSVDSAFNRYVTPYLDKAITFAAASIGLKPIFQSGYNIVVKDVLHGEVS